MPKSATRHVCSACGHSEARWVGRCPECRAYNTMQEMAADPGHAARKPLSAGRGGHPRTALPLASADLSSQAAPPDRVSTGHPELDRVLGGGLVEASAVLIGGSPGVGKSTLLLQVAANLAARSPVFYISGEESLDQIQLRARRLGVAHAPVGLIAHNDTLAIADHIESLDQGAIVIVDSLQVLHNGTESAPGSVSQVKAAAAHLIPAAKANGVTLIMVSHVTKDGNLAGPNTVKHAVDATLNVEADTSAGLFRIVRSEKNRFGAVDEVGVFEMLQEGLADVDNPSEVFISQRDTTAFGTVIFPSIEGTRPLLLEVQALVAPTGFGTGRRSATGWDTGRLNMLLATLAARMGLGLSDMDIYVNVAGGLRVADPAMDLAVVAAVLSAYAHVPLPTDLAVFGEVGLAGEVRNATRADARVKEASHLGFGQILCPETRTSRQDAGTMQIRRIAEILRFLPDLKDAYARAAQDAA